MKKQLTVLISLALALATTEASAAWKKGASLVDKDDVTLSQSATRYRSAYPQLGLGVATSTLVTIAGPALSLWYGLSQKTALQGYFAIGSSDPFTIGVGGIFKYTIDGGNYAGFHIGGGLGLGSTNSGGSGVFFVHILGNAGVHFYIPSLKNVIINIDAGPAFQIVDGNFQLAMAGYSTFLGLSVHYVF